MRATSREVAGLLSKSDSEYSSSTIRRSKNIIVVIKEKEQTTIQSFQDL